MRKMNMKRIQKRANNGITLIALVITIIVLLILAGVAIATLTGENGILTQAGKAKDKTTEADAIERVQVEVLGSYGTDGKIDMKLLNNNLRNIEGLTYKGGALLDSNEINILATVVNVNGYNIIIERNGNVCIGDSLENAINNQATYSENTRLVDVYGNIMVIPAGFKIAGDSAIDVTGGIVIEDATYTNTKGSQFVWIPVGSGENSIKKSDGTTEKITLGRYSFASDGTPSAYSGSYTEDREENHNSSYGNTIAKDIEGFITSVNNNHGYYIGRYEARKSSAGNLTEVGTDLIEISDRAVTQAYAAIKSRNMYSDTTFTSDLMNSYAWDTAIVFEQLFDDRTNAKKVYSHQTSINSDYAPKGTNALTDTASQDKICNIWDMASNGFEWTTETGSDSDNPCVLRGGTHYYSNSYYTSSRRAYPEFAYSSIFSYRPILYMDV